MAHHAGAVQQRRPTGGEAGRRLPATKAVGTAGPVGAAFAMIAQNWTCPECQFNNFAHRTRCNRCKAAKPEGVAASSSTGAGGTRPGLQMSALPLAGHTWRETVDPATRQLYYWNTATGETTWDRPAEMGAAPHASGWYGRGASATTPGAQLSSFYYEQNQKLLERKAPKQIKEIKRPDAAYVQGSNEFNIWYGRHYGDDHKSSAKRFDPAEHRCVVATDGGKTRADGLSGGRYFCIFFARGCCAKGHTCPYFHRIPTPEDEAAVLDEAHDCFGRERHKDHRDDMDGVGSLNNPCRTLYVGGLRCKPSEDAQDIVRKAFAEWGEVEHVNFIKRLMIGFVRYRLRSNAEFAKVAMAQQNLGNNEILNLKWAYDDPNPVAKAAIQRADTDAAIAMVRAQGLASYTPSASGAEVDFDVPAGYDMPAAKRPRIAGPAPAVGAYPQTAPQYSAPPLMNARPGDTSEAEVEAPSLAAKAAAAMLQQEQSDAKKASDALDAVLNRIDAAAGTGTGGTAAGSSVADLSTTVVAGQTKRKR